MFISLPDQSLHLTSRMPFNGPKIDSSPQPLGDNDLNQQDAYIPPSRLLQENTNLGSCRKNTNMEFMQAELQEAQDSLKAVKQEAVHKQVAVAAAQAQLTELRASEHGPAALQAGIPTPWSQHP